MNQLNVLSYDGKLVADSREVAKMTGKEHKELMRSIRHYVGILTSAELRSSDFFIPHYYQDAKKEQRPSFLLTRKGCDMVANKMTGRKGVLFTAEYVTKFEEMEKELSIINQPSYMIDDPIERAQRWITERKEYEQLEQQRQEELPYTNFGKAVSNSSAAINVGSFSKMMYDEHGIKLGRNKMFEWLRDTGYLINRGRERNQPKQKYIEQGLFSTTVTMINRTHGDVESVTTLITGKGQVKLSERLLQEFGVMN